MRRLSASSWLVRGVSRKHRPRKRRPLTADLENRDLENADLENADLENTELENVVCILIEKLSPFILSGRKKI